MNTLNSQSGARDDIQRLRQTAYSYIHNQNILFDQREAEIRQQLEQDYQQGLEERRKEQQSNYQKSFNLLRSKFADSPSTEAIELINDAESQVNMGLLGERSKDTELAQDQQNLLDRKRLEMARSREEQIPHDVRPVAKALEVDPSKSNAPTTWDAHLAYFNAKWKAEGFTVSEPYTMIVGNPPITLVVPGGQVAHAVNAPVTSGLELFPDLTREGLLQESQLAQLISNHPEKMGDILLSTRDFGAAQSLADDLRDIWKTHTPDNARDSILMLCTTTLDFHYDFEALVNGLSKEESAQKLAQGLQNAFPEKPQVVLPEIKNEPEKKSCDSVVLNDLPKDRNSPKPAQTWAGAFSENQQSALNEKTQRLDRKEEKPLVNVLQNPKSPKRVSVLDEIERESSKPNRELKKEKEKTLDF